MILIKSLLHLLQTFYILILLFCKFMSIKYCFYKKIRNLREDNDIKQKDMAKYLHMQLTTYNAYEKGKRTISANLLKNICIFLM